MDDSPCISSENVCNQSQAESLTQKRKNMDIEREAVNVSETVV